MKFTASGARGLNLLTYLKYAVHSEFDRFTAPSFLEHLYLTIRALAALVGTLLLAILIVVRDAIGPTLLIVGIMMTPIAYVSAVLATRMVVEAVIAIFIINDNAMMIRQGMENASRQCTRQCYSQSSSVDRGRE